MTVTAAEGVFHLNRHSCHSRHRRCSKREPVCALQISVGKVTAVKDKTPYGAVCRRLWARIQNYYESGDEDVQIKRKKVRMFHAVNLNKHPSGQQHESRLYFFAG